MKIAIFIDENVADNILHAFKKAVSNYPGTTRFNLHFMDLLGGNISDPKISVAAASNYVFLKKIQSWVGVQRVMLITESGENINIP